MRDELDSAKYSNEKLSSENGRLAASLVEEERKNAAFAEKSLQLDAEICALRSKLENAIHPDSVEMQQLMRERLSVAGKYMEEWKADAKKKYLDLEGEFREALKIEDAEKKALRAEIDRLKDEISDLKINQAHGFKFVLPGRAINSQSYHILNKNYSVKL